ncbi:TPA: hypothetical protein L5647_000973 [Pseudomonas aeruginosa]|nr:hypothetical protein CIW79_15800 [Pseudomonas aeruginosa]QJW74167.1 hypothetical protein F6W86_14185 [Pseudomonas aeruginosa]RTT28168.1 hypothetical protein DY951_15900 [Pseudomonas aeruginosa]RTT35963.1 hypothetical protein DY957_23310 [Pseudomonas aeruginosa]TEG39765.1 hypothetical protein IPC1341_03055 [Pseudomonas aeruginosa]
MRRCGGAAPGWGGRDRSRREDGAARRAPAGTVGIGAGRAGGLAGDWPGLGLRVAAEPAAGLDKLGSIIERRGAGSAIPDQTLASLSTSGVSARGCQARTLFTRFSADCWISRQ